MDIKTTYLSAPLSTTKATVTAKKITGVGTYMISEWTDEISELSDARKIDEFRADKDGFKKANPMSPEYAENADYYYELINDSLLRTCRDEKYPNEFDESDIEWAYGKVEEFNSWEKTQKAIELGKASKATLKQVKKYENDFTQSFNDSENEIQSIKKKRIYSDNGAELDMARVMCGDTDYWTSRKKTGKASVIRLGIDVGVSHDNGSSTFAKIAGIGIALAKEIQKKGYSLEIYKVGKNESSNNCFLVNQDNDSEYTKPEKIAGYSDSYLGFKTCLKGSQQNIDLERISNIGLEGIFRGCTFRSQGLALGHFNGYPRGQWSELELEAFGLDCVVSKRWVSGDQKTMISNLKKKLGI